MTTTPTNPFARTEPSASMMRMARLADPAPGPPPAPHYAETVPKFTAWACVFLTGQDGRPGHRPPEHTASPASDPDARCQKP
ncbi:hypothetical protein ACF07U_28770 [Streptomyces californicus]|uniref:hypothetical protein n=1 Tax=Streptomyces californicus TaxID=67351 RepID=UPI0036FD6064